MCSRKRRSAVTAAASVLVIASIPGITGLATAQCETMVLETKTGPNRFGTDVLVSGDRAFIRDSRFFRDQGAIYVFHVVEGEWQQESIIRPDLPQLRPNWGASVANQGQDTLFVGDFGPLDAPPFSGRCELYRRHGVDWVRTQILRPDDLQEGVRFGAEAAVDDDTLLVTARLDSDAGVGVGAVYVFNHSPDGWQQVAKLLPPPTHGARAFGRDVDVDGDWLVVGDPADDTFEVGGGAVHVFRRTKCDWTLAQSIAAPVPMSSGIYGFNVELCGTTLAVGMPFAASHGAGVVFVYRLESEHWSLEAELIPSTSIGGDNFGQCMSLQNAGAILAVGSEYGLTYPARPGLAHLFDRIDRRWTERWTAGGSEGFPGDLFGKVVDGRRLAACRRPRSKRSSREGVHVPRCPAGRLQRERQQRRL